MVQAVEHKISLVVLIQMGLVIRRWELVVMINVKMELHLTLLNFVMEPEQVGYFPLLEEEQNIHTFFLNKIFLVYLKRDHLLFETTQTAQLESQIKVCMKLTEREQGDLLLLAHPLGCGVIHLEYWVTKMQDQMKLIGMAKGQVFLIAHPLGCVVIQLEQMVRWVLSKQKKKQKQKIVLVEKHLI